MKTFTWTWWKWGLIVLAGSILSVGGFLLVSANTGFTGFPLDDAWIHQVYARNLAEKGEWAFNPGQPSGGSTSPLWSALMSVGVLLRVQPVFWSAILGCFTLFFSAVFAEILTRSWLPERKFGFPWIGLFFATEWHLVWAAVSGMETSLYICLILAVALFLRRGSQYYWLAGLLIGLCVWVRPDGITLLGPALMVVLLEKSSIKSKALNSLAMLGAFLLAFLPYLFFNLRFADSIWPSTFSAKQAEYIAATGYPILERIGSLFLPFLAGGGVILIPGMVAAVIFCWKRRMVEPTALCIWLFGYLMMYAIRLPVNYQHGRYMMPAMAVFFLLGLWGMRVWINLWENTKWLNLTKVFWSTSLGAVTLVFLILGSFTYATDVAIIETEMVTTARWVKDNIPVGKSRGCA